jgi:hypothetical protein
MNPEIVRAGAAYLVRRVGAVGWSGLAALAVAAALLAVDRLGLDPANRAAAEELVQLKDHLARGRLSGSTLNAAPDPIAMIVNQLPSADRVPVFVEAVQEQAARRSLQIDRAEYRVQKTLGGRALRYQLTMPAHGGYPQVRGWLEVLLHDYPSAALDELSLRRESDGAGQLEARVSLSFYSQAVR